MPGLTRYEPEEVEEVEILDEGEAIKEPVAIEFEPESNSDRTRFVKPLKYRI